MINVDIFFRSLRKGFVDFFSLLLEREMFIVLHLIVAWKICSLLVQTKYLGFFNNCNCKLKFFSI